MSRPSIKQIHDERIAAGLCTKCGCPAAINLKQCRQCLDERQAKRHANAASGLCYECACRPVVPGLKRCRQCLDAVATTSKVLLHNDLLAACDHYGGRLCLNCGETILRFLNVDHILGGGNTHAKQLGRSSIGGVIRLPQWLRNHGYPPGYQILCWNDNLGKSRNGNILVESDTLYVCDCRYGSSHNDICNHGLTYQQRWNRRVFLEAVNIYGGPRCVCCGITNLFYLTLDHEFNDRRKHQYSSHDSVARWARKHGYPQDIGLRVMCANCNCGRQYNNGVCPHYGVS